MSLVSRAGVEWERLQPLFSFVHKKIKTHKKIKVTTCATALSGHIRVRSM